MLGDYALRCIFFKSLSISVVANPHQAHEKLRQRTGVNANSLKTLDFLRNSLCLCAWQGGNAEKSPGTESETPKTGNILGGLYCEPRTLSKYRP